MIYYLHTVKWFQVLQFNPNSSICSKWNGFKYHKWLNYSIRSINGTLTGSTTVAQSGPWSNGYEGVLYILQSSTTGTSLSDAA